MTIDTKKLNGRGEQIAAKALAAALTELFRDSPVDWQAIGEDLVRRVRIEAVADMNLREQAMHRALTATMEYVGGVNRDLAQRVAELEESNRELRLAEARTVRLGGQDRAAWAAADSEVAEGAAAGGEP